MQLRRPTLVMLILFIQLNCLNVTGQEITRPSRTLVTEPIFGITYDYTKIHYDSIPPRVRKTCAGYEDGSFWTFAHFQKDRKDFYVVLGVQRGQNGDSLGSVNEIDGTRCQAEDSTWMLSGVIPAVAYSNDRTYVQLPGLNAKRVCDQGPLGSCHYVLRSDTEEKIIRGLVSDAIRRGIKAWGGEAQFKKAACVSTAAPDNSTTPIVTRMLGEFCGVPR